MAEGFLRMEHGDRFEAFSAGMVVTKVNPLARSVMNELHIDLSEHFSKLIDTLSDQEFDVVVTVCDDARENCPVMPGAKNTFHRSFKDPSGTGGSFLQRQNAFRKTRDEIRQWINSWTKTYFTFEEHEHRVSNN